MATFLAIYFGQMVYGLCVFFLLSGYDAVFIQCIMTLSYRFRTMARLLELLSTGSEESSRDDARDREVIGLVYHMHLSVLE